MPIRTSAVRSAGLEEHVVVVDGRAFVARIDADRVVELTSSEAADSAIPRWTPGFVDLHTHGAVGFGFDDADETGLREALDAQRCHGTAGSLLSLVSAPIDTMARRVRDLSAWLPSLLGAIGLHLEGPFLTPGKRGAHDPEALCAPSAEAVDALIEAGAGAESMGLIHSRRTAGNRRESRRDTLRVLAFVRASQRVGINLERIKGALDKLPDKGLPTKRDWVRISREWRDDLNDRIEYLTALRDKFSNCIGCGCSH